MLGSCVSFVYYCRVCLGKDFGACVVGGWGRDSGKRDRLLLSVLRDVEVLGGHV